MALQVETVVAAAQDSSFNSGRNYYTDEPVYIKNLNGQYADIFDPSNNAIQILQDGFANRTDENGEFSFAIEAGEYIIEIRGLQRRETYAGADYFNNRINETVNQIVSDISSSRGFRVVGEFGVEFTYELPNDVASYDDGLGNTTYWIYSDVSALPQTIADTVTDPTGNPDFEQVTFNQSSGVINGDGSTAQNTHDALKSILISQGLSGNFWFFTDGFTYNAVGDVGIDADGKMYTYTGSDPLPVTVPAGTNPVGNGDYKIRVFNSAENITTTTGGSTSVASFIAARNSFLLLGNGADITTELESISDTGGTIELGAGFEYTLSSTVSFDKLPNIIGNNAKIKLINTGAIKSESNRSLSSVSITQNQSKGDKTLVVSDSSAFSVGDFFFLQNNVDFSFCGARDYYRDGDLCEITGISGNTLSLANGLELDVTLDGGNPSKYSIHELNQRRATWSDLEIVADGTSTVSPVIIDGMSLHFDNVQIRGRNGNHAASLSAIYKSKFINGCELTNQEDSGGFGYGLGLRGGRFIEFSNAYLYARRHASSMTSGGTALNTPPVRDITFNRCVFDSFGNVNNTHAADGHGASDRVYYYDCTSYAGVVMGGSNCYWLGGEIHSNQAQGGMYLREWVGGDFVFKPNVYYHNANTAPIMGHHSSTELDAPYDNVNIQLACDVINSESFGQFAVSLVWNTPDTLGLSVGIDKLNFKDEQPTDSLVFVSGQDAGQASYVKQIAIKESNFSGGPKRWMRKLGGFINPQTRITLPNVFIHDSVTVPAAGKSSKTILSDVRYPMSNVNTRVSFSSVSESGIVVGNMGALLVDGDGYYYYSQVTAQEITGDFTSSHDTPVLVEFVVNDVNPTE